MEHDLCFTVWVGQQEKEIRNIKLKTTISGKFSPCHTLTGSVRSSRRVFCLINSVTEDINIFGNLTYAKIV